MKKGSNTPQEIELKLELEPEALGQVLAHPLFEAQARANPVTQTLQSIYFDTPDQVLRQAGISLRIRRNGHQRIQTIKAARSLDGVALTRSEWEHEVAGDRPDYTLAAESALKPVLKH
jgi:inorganic triphosphatase YgiF